jgi:multidrug efflux pump subunit AcrA (membrane-fusion protein)
MAYWTMPQPRSGIERKNPGFFREPRFLAALLAGLVLLAGCTPKPTPTPTPTATPLPPIGRSDPSGAIRASAKVVPVREAQLAYAATGRVKSVAVAVGDRVAAGTLLVALDDAAAQAAVAQAQAARRRAQAELEALQAGPRPQELAAAQARVDAAAAHLAQLSEEPRPADVAAAQAELAAAQARAERLYGEPDVSVVAAARAEAQQAQAALDRLLNPATPGQIAEAEANLRSAQAELDLLSAGARPEAVAAAAAVVAEAEATLQQAEAALAALALRAPFTGTVTALEISPGETVAVGQVVLVLADLSQLQVETTDLSERDVVQVAPGQPVTVLIEPLQTEVPGRVVRVAPQASVIGGDVVYTVVVDLEAQPPNLRWGMSAEVGINAQTE